MPRAVTQAEKKSKACCNCGKKSKCINCVCGKAGSCSNCSSPVCQFRSQHADSEQPEESAAVQSIEATDPAVEDVIEDAEESAELDEEAEDELLQEEEENLDEQAEEHLEEDEDADLNASGEKLEEDPEALEDLEEASDSIDEDAEEEGIEAAEQPLDDSAEQVEEVEEVAGEVTEEMQGEDAEPMEETETDQVISLDGEEDHAENPDENASGEKNGAAAAGQDEELFTIDKTAMDMEVVTSKTKKQRGKKSQDKSSSNKATTEKKGPNKGPEKSGKDERKLSLKRRVLKLIPIRMADITSDAMAPVLERAVSYSIRSEGGPSHGLIGSDPHRSMEIWFHTEEEAEEMHVKIFNMNFKVKDKKTKISALQMNVNTDKTLERWDAMINPLGIYEGRCVFVNNIPAHTTMDMLHLLFPKAKGVKLPKDKDGNNQGYATVEFHVEEEARSCVKRHNEFKMKIGENVLNLYTIGFQRAPRTKAAHHKLTEDRNKMHQIERSNKVQQGTNQQRQGGNQQRQGGNQQRQGGNQQRQGGNQQRQGGNQQRQGGNQQRPGGNLQRKRGNTGGGAGKRGADRDMGSPSKRSRMDNQGGRRNSGPLPSSMMGSMDSGLGMMGRISNRELQLRQEVMMAQRGDAVQNIRGELLGQMQRLQQGGLSDPVYLMNLAQRLQQAQQGILGPR